MSDLDAGTGSEQAGVAPPPPQAFPPPPAPPVGLTPAPPPPYAPPAGAIPGLSSPGKRLGQYLLDGLLIIVTAVIGWFIWSLFIWRRGETPGMQILRMKVVKADTGQPATWGTMFLREFVGKFLVMSILGFIPILPLVLDFMLLWDARNQQLWDKMAGTVVLDNPN